MAGRKHILDAAQRERLLRLNRQGVSIDNLATRFGVKRSMVVKTLIRMRRAEVMHSCDNPPCFNPDHLFEGTQRENMEDMIRKGRGPFSQAIPLRDRGKEMKVRGNDGIVRQFQVATPQTVNTAYGPKETGYMGEARCVECGEEFGVHDTSVLKPRFREHCCNSKVPRS